MENETNINISVKLFKKRKLWIAFCKQLKVYGYSETGEKEALEDFVDALKSYFHVMRELGTLEHSLKELKWIN